MTPFLDAVPHYRGTRKVWEPDTSEPHATGVRMGGNQWSRPEQEQPREVDRENVYSSSRRLLRLAARARGARPVASYSDFDSEL